MDGWMDGWMDGRADGRTDGWMDGRMDRRMDGWTDRHTHTHRQTQTYVSFRKQTPISLTFFLFLSKILYTLTDKKTDKHIMMEHRF